jgi:hypothetical protein
MPIMARKKRRKSQGSTDPTPQRRHREATYKRRALREFWCACIEKRRSLIGGTALCPCQIREKLARFNLEGQASVIVWAAEPEA